MFRKREDRDFQTEIESHIRLEADRLIADGMTPSEANAAARRTFGNVVTSQERFYESQRWLWWDQLIQDLRHAFRLLWRTPAFTATAAFTIALGVGANTAVFSLVDAVLLQSLPVRNPNELVFPEAVGDKGSSGAPPYQCLMRFRTEVSAFAQLAAFTNHDELRVELDGRPEQIVGQVVSGNYFDLLGVKPVLGRLLEPRDEALNPPVAVISHRLWLRRFGGDAAVIGKTFSQAGTTFTIVGVTPKEYWGLKPGSSADLSLPIKRQSLADAGASGFHAIARLKPGVAANQALAESDAVFQSFIAGAGYPAGRIKDHFRHLELRPADRGEDGLRSRFAKPLFVLMGIVGLVLLMATANIANLLLVRGIARRREFAIRLATGAGRGRLVRQLLTETLLLFGIGAIPGVLLAAWGVGVIQTMFAAGRRAITLDASLNWRVLAFCVGVTLLAGLLSSLFPAWRAFRTNPETAMKEGQARTGESRGSARLTQTLVAFQVALSLVLLVGAVTFVRTMMNLRNTDAGFRGDQVLTMSIELADGYVRYDRKTRSMIDAQARKTLDFWSRVLDGVRGVPGVRTAALSVLTPLSGRDRGAPVNVRGFVPSEWRDSSIRVNPVSEGYFETLGVPLLRGRLFTDRDTEGSLNVAVINDSAARKYFGDREPIGQALEFPRTGTPNRVYRVIGVVQDSKHINLRDPVPPFAFIPIRQPLEVERRITLIVSGVTDNPEMALLPSIRRTVGAVDPGLLISEVITMRRQLDSSLLTERLLSGLSSAFGILALILASVGLYGVLSYRIGQQRQAIGIRMALGESTFSISFNVLRQSGLVIAAGLVCGLPFAVAAARTADSMLWGVNSSDPLIYALGVAVLCVVGFASAWLPARRAAAIAPAEALRQS